MNKLLLRLILIIACTENPATTSHAYAMTHSEIARPPQNIAHLKQVYSHNEYIIAQLRTLARALEFQPRHLGAHLEQVSMPLLVVKLNSLNHLIKNELQPELIRPYLPVDGDVNLSSTAFLQQSQLLVNALDNLFQHSPASGDKQATVTATLVHDVTHDMLYQQFMQIESLLLGSKKYTQQPRDVYDVVLRTRTLLSGHCISEQNKKPAPLLMGKRPRDVYLQLLDYITLLSQHTTAPSPARRPGRILPQDVFNIAIIALAYSHTLLDKPSKNIQSGQLERVTTDHSTEQYQIITPSHVYQAVRNNIATLECMTHAS